MNESGVSGCSASLPPIGLIAGRGRLPVMIARGVRDAGRRVACVGLRDQFDHDLPEQCDFFGSAGVIRLGRWISLLRKWGVRELVIVGKVEKARMYDPLRLIRQFPDWRAAKVWYGVVKKDRRSARLLAAVADELARNGLTVIDSTKYIPDSLAPEGVMTKRPPTSAQLADIEFAMPIVTRLNELDIGQAVTVKDCEVIAVEAIEGTDALIRRTGELCRSRGWTLVKTAKPAHDMRFDVPTVGPMTIDSLAKAGGGCLVLQAGRVIIADKPAFLEAAEKAKIVVVGWAPKKA